MLTEPTLTRAATLTRANSKNIDLVELRVDFLQQGELSHLWKFPQMIDKPAILTIRRVAEGGLFRGAESERRRLLDALSGGYRYVDLESDVDRSFDTRVPAGVRVIRSMHDTTGIPDQLARLVMDLPRSAGEIAKVAVTPRSGREMVDLIETAQRIGMPGLTTQPERIVLGMGRFGIPTRILAAHLGNFLTFCSLEGRSAAPGHLGPGAMTNVYRFHSIKATTRVLGVVGTPLAHSRSPQIHNLGLAAAGLDTVYVPIELDDLSEIDRLARALPIDGCSVTIPHKAHAACLSDASSIVQRIGACNTLVRTANGWLGENSDVTGFLATLDEMRFRPRCATVIGAGGAARAVAFALRSRKTDLLILNRTAERAQRLARDCGATAGSLVEEGISKIADFNELIVQTTSVGLPDNPGDPLGSYRFSGKEVVYDIVYGESLTPILSRAQMAGCVVIDGRKMLAEQAYEQFQLFTGQEFPESAKLKVDSSTGVDTAAERTIR